MSAHDVTVTRYPDHLLQSVYEDLRQRNLRDYSNHEVRWQAERLSAVAAERKRRGLKSPPKTLSRN